MEDLGQWGLDQARAQAVHSDPGGAEVRGHVAGEEQHAAFRHVVRGLTGEPDESLDAGEVHDASGAPLGHVAHDVLRDQPRAGEVHAEDSVPLFAFHRVGAANAEYPGRVDEDVEMPERGHDLGDGLFDRTLVAHVDLPPAGRRGAGRLVGDIESRGEAGRARGADPRRRAGHERGPARESLTHDWLPTESVARRSGSRCEPAEHPIQVAGPRG